LCNFINIFRPNEDKLREDPVCPDESQNNLRSPAEWLKPPPTHLSTPKFPPISAERAPKQA